MSSEFIKKLLIVKGIREEDVCHECNGVGVKGYANTSTWRRGIGGSVCTKDVCDKCWGSGDRVRPWISHKKVNDIIEENKLLKEMSKQ